MPTSNYEVLRLSTGRYDILQHGLSAYPWYDFWFRADDGMGVEAMWWASIRFNAGRFAFWRGPRVGRFWTLACFDAERWLGYYDGIFREMRGLDAAVTQAQREALERPRLQRHPLTSDAWLPELCKRDDSIGCTTVATIL